MEVRQPVKVDPLKDMVLYIGGQTHKLKQGVPCTIDITESELASFVGQKVLARHEPVSLAKRLQEVDKKDQPIRFSRPLVVGYYTVGTPYEQEAQVLRLSLNGHGYKYHIEGVPNLGTWQKNTQFKAKFLWSMLNKFPGQKLLYLDVDAIMILPPLLLDSLECDIAAVHFQGNKHLMSGTIFLGNTPKCREVVRQWISMNERYPETLPDRREAWDQRTLEIVLRDMDGVDFVELPQGYTWVTQITPDAMPDLAPVILHTRGAFRFREKVNCPGLVDERLNPWVVFPTVNIEKSVKTVEQWKMRGYKVAVLTEKPLDPKGTGADYVIQQPMWRGFPRAVNRLCHEVNSQIVVVAGDDIMPEQQATAYEIASKFVELFPDMMGVMQPIGDQYTSYLENAISPWIGRKFIETVYGGKGPYFTGYFHYFSDRELQEVAIKLGCFKQVPEFTQFHDHWQRRGAQRPAYLLNALKHWQWDKDTFDRRRLEGFPGCEVVAKAKKVQAR